MRPMTSDKIRALAPSGIRKFFDIVHEMPDAISLGVGEPDFDTPWNIREEGIYSLERGRTFYTSNAGLMPLREEISRYLMRLQGLKYDPKSEILVTVGGSEAIDIALRCIVNPGDEVLIPEPSYVSYRPCAVMADAKPVTIELQESNGFKLTAKQLEEAITDRTRVLVMPFPNNPTGSIMTKEELEPLVPIIIKHDLIVISDEIYCALTYSGRHFSIAELPGMQERTVLIGGFSKAFAMTGWRLGYACGPEEIISQMTKLHQFTIMCAPTTSQYAAVEALANSQSEVDQMVAAYNERRRFLLHAFKEMGIECFEPFGAFYVFPSIRKFGMSSEEFATRLLMEQKLAVVPGTAFGACGEGNIRISYAYSIDDLKNGLSRIEAFINSLR
ncbi:MAG: aminotransferase class I/II-fold pyridoxal phosphate-dependent enzyme [Lachnospiraceae bacterium]|nr:aminotransferase class I/II-fold pyridoxal phosphate-dependent enzyme [Lachnospiraceae bacterium]MCH4032118.1 aminotransferase class I/II-fold pyridoxal phosphate-dependent enzyme [Lachnospiraceae bacterium]MCH4109004.1 aminotransferase class I/II-fold pyridoxal phosphate-dependent enzyme [Lachnospiraceae bacterium]MCI1302242.1 aminotransferase class I/II-fold pyridoxal phosphate-dependent enzyme [Lachnospiraceae bacterium]MCI1332783.1 aminotransferase class I/II-fold pyridoxal phosphate-dep